MVKDILRQKKIWVGWALAASLVWGYFAEWSPYYVKLFQGSNITLIGSIQQFRRDCSDSPTSTTFCSNEYVIPAEFIQNATNRTLGLGVLTSEIVVKCADLKQSMQTLVLGDLERPYRKSNIFREYRTLALDLFKCSNNLLVQTWVRHHDLRKGYIAGQAMVGETASVDDYRKLLDYIANGFLIVLALLMIPLLVVHRWFKELFKIKIDYQDFFHVTVLWSITISLISGIFQLIFPVPAMHMVYRIGANLMLLLSVIATGRLYFRTFKESSLVTKVINSLTTNKFIKDPYFTFFLSPFAIACYSLFFFQSWSTLRTTFSLIILTLFLLCSINMPIEFCLFSALGILSELKIYNVDWAPESSTYITFIGLLLLISTGVILRNELDKILRRIVSRATDDKRLAAQLVHDIRSPVAVLKLLLGQVDWKEDQVPIKETVLGSIDKISVISKTVLGQNREHAGNMCSTEPIISALEEARLRFSHQPKVNITIDNSCNFRIDSVLLYRIAQNLIVNAFETEGVTEVRISVQKVPNVSLLKIENNGVLPPEEILKKIIEAGGTYGKTEGTGLGLNFCRQEVIKHGGETKIYVNGSFFVVEIRL